jgi:phage terminase large subunit-like protein
MDTRYGEQTPTVSVIEPYEKTLGQEAIDLYNKTDHQAIPWQESMIYDIMAVNEDGLWAHQKFGFSLARRNGKSEIILARCLRALKYGERVLYTAHRTATSHAIWERLGRMCEQAGIEIKSSLKGYGKEHLITPEGGGIWFRTRTSTGGLGEGYDLLIIDEAQEYTPEQATALQYVVTDSQNPQTIMIGTPPTAVSAGTVFPEYRKTLLQGGGYESGWCEWSVPELSDKYDEDLWYKTNPSLGYFLQARAIRSETAGDEIDFNIQRLGHWLSYNQKSAITAAEWDALKVDELPKLKGKLFVGVKFGHDNENVSVSIAVKTADDKIFVEAIDCRPIKAGLEWILSFLDAASWRTVAVDGDNGKMMLKDAMKQAKIGKAVIPSVPEIINAYALWEQGIARGNIVHMEQSAATQVITNCEKRAIGSKGGFGYQSQIKTADISILDSMALAYWQCYENKGSKKQNISY